MELGVAFSWLVRPHRTGDYSGSMHISPDEAQEAVDKAYSILQLVCTTRELRHWLWIPHFVLWRCSPLPPLPLAPSLPLSVVA
jgi:hypothetical protein